MKKIVNACVLLFILFAFVSCMPNTQTQQEIVNDEEIAQLTQNYVAEFINEDFSNVYEMSSQEVKNAITLENLEQSWIDVLANAGNYIGIEKSVQVKSGNLIVASEYLVYENVGIVVSISYDEQKTVSGLFFNYYTSGNVTQQILPEGLTEKEYTVTTQEYEMSALLTSAQGNDKTNVLLLVHGSGPNDMDETVGGIKMFRDIAWNASEMGVDVFRYNKRTNVYAQNIVPKGDEFLTVNEEVIQDVHSAAQLLIDEGYENIYIVGHSLGGMLGPRIISENPEMYAGFISLAGSPRTLTDIIISQYFDVHESADDSLKKEIETLLSAEQEKLNAIDTYNEEKLTSTTIFGLYAYYIKDINFYDTMSLAQNLNIPMLFLHGSDDFQVTIEDDFNVWKEGMEDKENAVFKEYDGLTHMFTENIDNPTNTVNDYAYEANVPRYVIEDIVNFVKEQ